MKECPHCNRKVSDTAIRCKYCRRPFSVKKRPLPKLKIINLEPGCPAWSIKEVLFLWLLVFAANFALELFQLTPIIMDFLRNRYFLLTKEPALMMYLYIFIATFILKLTAVGIIWIILRLHKVKLAEGLNLNRPVEKKWLWLFPAFCVFAIACRLISDTDPLSPNLSLYLFFRESSIIGNIAMLFSLVIVAPVSEEIFFRGFVYPGINKKLGFYWATFITASLFAAVHVPQCREHPFIIFAIFLGGIFLTLVRAITKSTLLTVLLHAAYNFTIIAVGFIKFMVLKY